jgi:hemolysin type calcium-binding protein
MTVSGVRRLGLGLAAAVVVAGGALIAARSGYAAYVAGTPGNDILFGRDDDVKEDAAIQPPGTTADQSLSKGDILFGFEGDDLLIGLLGLDLLDGGPGDDVLVGGTEQGTLPNQDYQVGGEGDDVSVWAGGDGSEAFIGGPGTDAIVFAVIDRDATTNIPTPKMVNGPNGVRGVVTANLLNAPGFCQIDPAPEASGYDWLVRFVRRTDNVLLVTVRVRGVEQVFCSSKAGNGAEWADLTTYSGGELRPITLERIREINPLVGEMVR